MRATIRPYERPLPLPLATAHGTWRTRRGALLSLEDEGGFRGRGEAAPLPGSDPRGAAEAAVSGARLFLRAARDSVSPALLLGAEDPEAQVDVHRFVRDAREAREAVRDGLATLKVKVGAHAPEADEARVLDIAREVGRDVSLRIDANRAWTPEVAEALLGRWPVSLCEEPITGSDPEQLARLRSAVSVPLAVDESCRDMASLAAFIAAGSADVLVLKPSLCGGPEAAVELGRRAAAAGLGVLVTTAFETEVGWAAALAVARALPPASRLVCGLDPSTSIIRRPVPDDALPHPLAQAALARPDHPAVVATGGTWTWAELAERVATAASGILARGLGPGALIGIAGPPSPRWIEALWAASWIGATGLPVPPGPEGTERLRRARPDLVLDCARSLPRGPRAPARPWPLSEERLRLFTSGTTAAPRAVSLTASQLAASTLGSAGRLGHLPGDRWLCALPLHHIGGLSILLRTAWLQTTMVLREGFDPAAVSEALDDGSTTLASLTPGMLRRLLDERDDRAFRSSVRALLVGGAATPPELVARCRSLGAPIALTWGMSEAASQVATRFAGDLDPAAGVGPPLSTASVRVVAGDRLEVRGPLVAGRLLTGDRGALDEEGRVHVHGRADGVLRSGAELVAPAEVEARLAAHPAVSEALVVGLPDLRWGERPGALLVRAAAADSQGRPDLEGLRSWVREALAPWAAPDRVRWVEALPVTSLGKPSRSAARRLLLEEAGAAQDVDHEGGHRDRLEALHVDEGVHVPDAGPEVGLGGPPHLEREGQGGPAQALDLDADRDALREPEGLGVVRVRVDEGHAPALLVEDRGEARAAGDEELLERLVAVLEDPPEERDPGPIDLVEADRQLVAHRHPLTSRSAEGIA